MATTRTAEPLNGSEPTPAAPPWEAPPAESTPKRKHVKTTPETRMKKGPARQKPEAEDLASSASYELDQAGPKDFFEQLRSYSPLEWEERLFLYLYRIKPIIDRTRLGKDMYIMKAAAPIYPDDIMTSKAGGSGVYKLILIRWDPGTRDTNRIRDHIFTIMNPEYPPRVPLGEWVTNENNSEWAWAKPMLEAEAAAAKGTMTPGADMKTGLDFASQLLERYGPNHDPEAIAAAVKKEMGGDGRNDRITEMLFAHFLKDRDAKPAAGPDRFTELLFAQLEAEKQRSHELTIELRKGAAAAAAPVSIVDELNKIVALKETLGGLFGKQTAAKVEGKSTLDVVSELGSKFVDNLPLITRAAAMFTSGKPGPPAPGGAPAAMAPGAPPAAMQAASGPQEENQQPQEAEPMKPAPATVAMNMGPMLDGISEFLIHYYKNGAPGMDFRDWFVEEHGNRVYLQIRALGPKFLQDVIAARTNQVGEPLRSQLSQLAPPEQMKTFIEEFCSDAPGSADEPDTATATNTVTATQMNGETIERTV